jgi:hypothetical protein
MWRNRETAKQNAATLFSRFRLVAALLAAGLLQQAGFVTQARAEDAACAAARRHFASCYSERIGVELTSGECLYRVAVRASEGRLRIGDLEPAGVVSRCAGGVAKIFEEGSTE